MPRPRKVSIEDTIEAFKELVDLFPKDKFPGPTDPVWKELNSTYFQNKWNARDVYREIHDDRLGLWTKAKEEKNRKLAVESTGIIITSDSNHEQSSINLSAQSSDNSCLSDVTDIINDIENNSNTTGSCDDTNISPKKVANDDSDNDDDDWEAPGLTEFIMNIDEEFYNHLIEANPVKYKNRNYTVLKRWEWCDMLIEKFNTVTTLPCAFVFSNSKVHTRDDAQYHVYIEGECSSRICGNKFFGMIDSIPVKFPTNLRVRTKDTSGKEHEEVKRPVRKYARNQSCGLLKELALD